MIRIYGASDDLVEVEGDIEEEFGALNKRVILRVGDRSTGGIIVGLEYGPAPYHPSVWVMSIQPLDDGYMPPWPIRIEQPDPDSPCSYSLAVVVECPPGTPVTEEPVLTPEERATVMWETVVAEVPELKRK